MCIAYLGEVSELEKTPYLHQDNHTSVNIRPLRLEDFDHVIKWSRDHTFCLANDWELNRNKDELFEWWQHCVEMASADIIRLGIERKNTLIGYVDLANIKGHVAEMGIAIGDSALWGKGLGHDACVCAMTYACTYLDITVFTAETHASNMRSRKMLERVGFKEVARKGSEVYLGVETPLIQYKISL